MTELLSRNPVWEQIPIAPSAVLDLVPDFVGVANRDGRIMFVNQSGRRMLGLEPGEDVTRFLIHDFFPTWTVASLESSAGGNGNGDGKHDSRWSDWSPRGRLRTRDGRELPAAHAVIAHTGDDSAIECFTIIARGAFAPADDAVSVQRTELDALITESIAVARASLPETVSIEESLTCWNSAVLADPTQIHQMVMNLCLNSAQSMSEGGGQIFINTNRVTVKGPDEPGGTALRAGNYVRLTIRDNGPGLEPSVATRVFEPTVGTSHADTMHYGLWNVKRTVVNSGGDIFVETAPGRGTAFHVYMPLLGANGNGSGP